MLPNLAAHQRQRIAEGRSGLVVPGRLPDGQLTAFGVLMGHKRHQREQRQQGGRGPQDGQVRPLALSLHTQVFSDLMQGDFQLPPQDKPLYHLHRGNLQIGREQGLRLELAFGIADHDPTNRQRRLTAVIPDGGVGDNLDNTTPFTIPVRNADPHPFRFAVLSHVLQGWQALTFLTWGAVLMGPSRWSGFIQRRIHPEPNDQADWPWQLRQLKQPQNRGKTAVRDDDQLPLGQPAAQLHYHLAAPVGQLLMSTGLLLIKALRRRQASQEGQRPRPSRPRNRGQQHQTQPAQSTGLDEVTVAGTDRVAIDPLRFDLGTPPTFNGVVDPADNRSFRHKRLDQQQQQRAAQGPTRPGRAVEHAMIRLKLPLATQPHNAQRGCDRPGAWHQNRTDQQNLCVLPNQVGKVRRKDLNQAKIVRGQGSHGQSSWPRIAVAYPARSSFATGQSPA